ncbi:MAG: glycogen-binding domain-containing protein [Gemmatimonas sp.]
MLASLAAHPVVARAQDTGARPSVTPAAPSAAVGAITNLSTVSLMGTTALPSGDESGMPPRQQLFMGLTQPLGRIGEVKFTAIGKGYWQMRDAVASSSSAEGAIALRATGRVNGVRSWGAIAYGRAGALGALTSGSLAPTSPLIGLDGGHVDTTVSRRVDIGSVAHAESGILGSSHGFDMTLGLSVERATRTTTQTVSIQPVNETPLGPLYKQDPIVRTLRGVQRREIATGLASLGWRTGHTAWLTSLSAPVYSWISKDVLTPKPNVAPVIVSLAVAQPVTAWLSAVGSASTNPTSVGGTTLSDNGVVTRHGTMSPVFALGVSVARVPFRNRHGESTLNGILGFESRVIEALDSVIVMADSSVIRVVGDSSYRVLLMIDAPAAGYVEMMGDATAWTISNMSRGGDGRWRAELKLTVGAHRLAVRVDGGDWIAPPGLPLARNDFGNPVGLLVMEPRTKR